MGYTTQQFILHNKGDAMPQGMEWAEVVGAALAALFFTNFLYGARGVKREKRYLIPRALLAVASVVMNIVQVPILTIPIQEFSLSAAHEAILGFVRILYFGGAGIFFSTGVGHLILLVLDSCFGIEKTDRWLMRAWCFFMGIREGDIQHGKNNK